MDNIKYLPAFKKLKNSTKQHFRKNWKFSKIQFSKPALNSSLKSNLFLWKNMKRIWVWNEKGELGTFANSGNSGLSVYHRYVEMNHLCRVQGHCKHPNDLWLIRCMCGTLSVWNFKPSVTFKRNEIKNSWLWWRKKTITSVQMIVGKWFWKVS